MEQSKGNILLHQHKLAAWEENVLIDGGYDKSNKLSSEMHIIIHVSPRVHDHKFTSIYCLDRTIWRIGGLNVKANLSHHFV